jgi:hypothetical protein
MDESVAASRAAFLADVSRRVSAQYRDVAFAEILDELIAWSSDRSRQLQVRTPGTQHTVSYAVRKTGDVLWAAYPRGGDGAKLVILPRRFRHLSETAQAELIQRHSAAVPEVHIEGTGTLECPMHLLTSDRALAAYMDVLDEARQRSLSAAT